MTLRNTLYLPVLLLLVGFMFPVKECAAEQAIPADKVLHTSVSLLIGMAAYDFYRKNTKLTDNQAKLAAFVSTLAVGATKEFIDDEFDWGDMAANSVGAGVGIMIKF